MATASMVGSDFVRRRREMVCAYLTNGRLCDDDVATKLFKFRNVLVASDRECFVRMCTRIQLFIFASKWLHHRTLNLKIR